jgi:hypothetical protein
VGGDRLLNALVSAKKNKKMYGMQAMMSRLEPNSCTFQANV